MTIKGCILANVGKCFDNTSIPCDSLFKEKMKKSLNIDCDVVERTNEHIVVDLLFSDTQFKVKFNLRESSNGRLYVSSICEIF